MYVGEAHSDQGDSPRESPELEVGVVCLRSSRETRVARTK